MYRESRPPSDQHGSLALSETCKHEQMDAPEEDVDADAVAPHKRRWLPRNVKITLMVLVLFFVGEYILLPELSSARKEFRQLGHLNFLWLILGAAFEVASLAAYAQLTHTVLYPEAPPR